MRLNLLRFLSGTGTITTTDVKKKSSLRKLPATGVVVRIAPRLLSPVLVGVAIRQIGVVPYASVVVALAAATVASQFSELGLNQLLIREVARGGSAHSAVVAATQIKLVLIATVATVSLLTSYIILGTGPHLSQVLTALTGVWIASVGAAPDAGLIAVGESGKSNTINGVFNLTAIAFPTLALLIFPSVETFLLGQVLAGLVYTVLTTVAFRRGNSEVRNGSHVTVRQLLGHIGWFAGSSFVEPLYSRVDALILNVLSSASQVTSYAAVYIPVNIGWTAAETLGVLQLRHLRENLYIERIYSDLLIASLGLSSVTYVVCDIVVSLLLPLDLRAQALDAAVWISAATGLVVINRLSGVTLKARGSEKRAALLTLIGVGINIGLNLGLDSYFGSVGAGGAMYVSELFLLLAYSHVLGQWSRLLFVIPLASLTAILCETSFDDRVHGTMNSVCLVATASISVLASCSYARRGLAVLLLSKERRV